MSSSVFWYFYGSYNLGMFSHLGIFQMVLLSYIQDIHAEFNVVSAAVLVNLINLVCRRNNALRKKNSSFNFWSSQSSSSLFLKMLKFFKLIAVTFKNCLLPKGLNNAKICFRERFCVQENFNLPLVTSFINQF